MKDPPHREPRQLSAVLDAQLLTDPITIRFDRMNAQVHPFRDLACFEPFADQPQRLEFAVGKGIDR